MDFFKKAISTVSHELKDIQSKGKVAIQKIEQKIQSTIDKPTFEADVIHVIDRIYWMNFPSSDKIASLSKYLNSKFQGQYYIWNVSEHKYEVFPFNNQVAEHNMPGYPTPTLYEIFMICKSILSWLDSDPENVAIVHCQNTRGRSALIISCLLCLKNRFKHSGEALTFFCQQTRTKDFKILFPSQQLYLNYFANVMNGMKMSNKKLRLKKIIFSEVPRIGVEKVGGEDDSFRPYIQIFQDSKILFNSLNAGRVAAYSESDLSIWFDLGGTEVTEDILIRCKHYESNKLRFPVFRMMLHTGFTQDNILRMLKTDIDFTDSIYVSDQFFIDVIFEESSTNSNSQSEKTNLEYIVEDCRRKQAQYNFKSNSDQIKQDSHKQVEQILETSEKTQPSQQEKQPAFSIADHSEPSEKRKEAEEEEDEDKKSESGQSDDSNSDQQKEIAEPEDANLQSEDKMKAQQLLLKDKTIDVELDDQEIDDYLDNLEKSDDES